MLQIKETVISQIFSHFISKDQEQGFLLGSALELCVVDHCRQLPALRSGLHFYEADNIAADKMIRAWANTGICFCGMIHSHVVDKNELSDNDIVFAKRLFEAYALPVLWFGIGIVKANAVEIRFFSVSEDSGGLCLCPAEVYVT